MERRARRTETGSHLQIRLAETIAGLLRERILSNSFPGGHLPPQDQLAADYSVSAPSIREALRVLEAEGLVTVRRGKFGGAEIHRPNASSISYAIGLTLHGQGVKLHDVARSLLLLEPICMAACAEREDRHEVLLPLLRDNIEWTAESPDPLEFASRARGFHDLTIEHSPLATIRLLVGSLLVVWAVQEELWASVMRRRGHPDSFLLDEVLAEHRAIADAIEAGDAATTKALAERHLQEMQELTLSRWGEQIIDAASPQAVHGFRVERSANLTYQSSSAGDVEFAQTTWPTDVAQAAAD